jgi:hypothetical protein
MIRRKVLVIGMIDSIHFARWLSQFKESGLDIRVFPSTYFKRVHPKLLENESPSFKLAGFTFAGRFYGYLDYLVTLSFAGTSISRILRKWYLCLYVHTFRPEIIHAIEIQHAGYLVSSLKFKAKKQILTNWGSDIYFFQHLEGHKLRIQNALMWATHYSAECTRDYLLARDLGFQGEELPKIPNGGGFSFPNRNSQDQYSRNQISVKCYGGQFGLGRLAIQETESIMEKFGEVKCFYYSVTDDLLNEVERVKRRFPDQVRYSSIRNGMSHQALLNELGNSRLYLGLSRSDGLSTSFLEAIIQGAYPIQTDTSCANELVALGAQGTLVSPDDPDLQNKIVQLYFDETKLLASRDANWTIAKEYLNYDLIKRQAKVFYCLAGE